MSSQPTDGPSSGWPNRLRALIGGHAVASAAFLHIAISQPAGLDPPPESVALFVVATAAGVISYRLLVEDPVGGALAAILTGLYTLIVVGIVALGVYGPAGPRTNSVGPVAYILLTVGMVLVAGQVWRARASAANSAAL